MEFDNEYRTKLDVAKLSHATVVALMMLEVLLLGNMSMLDAASLTGMCSVRATTDHSRRPDAISTDGGWSSAHKSRW